MNLGYDYGKLRASIRYWLLGRGYYLAHEAMEFGLKHHTGVRKDGTPEFSHQIFQAQFLRTLEPWLIDAEGTFVTVFLHDVVEDIETVTLDMVRAQFGDTNAHSIDLMTNRWQDETKKPKESYYGAMVDDPRASIAKGIDRLHNHQSMQGVFSDEKRVRYMGETEEFIIPMLKKARRKFPQQEPAYQNVKHVLLTQMELIRFHIPQGSQS